MKLFVITDDFTGALDTGVQFASRGAKTAVAVGAVPDPAALKSGPEVFVLDAETRHMSGAEAYETVFRAVRSAVDAGCTHIYKKTDSALRGNVGRELRAAADASGGRPLLFIPAFPKMNRITSGGIHYIDGIPVAESAFGRDPFEPVTVSSVPALFSDGPSGVCLHPADETVPLPLPGGIHIFDASTEEDLVRIGTAFGVDGLRLSAGCAGFAAVLADLLFPAGTAPAVQKPESGLFIVCGSVHPATLAQIRTAREAGIPCHTLSPFQKLEPEWPDSAECRALIPEWIRRTREDGCFILSANGEQDRAATEAYAAARFPGLSLRTRIADQLGVLTRTVLEAGLSATLLCTGGDTLLAVMHALEIRTLRPLCEAAAGVVLTECEYNGRTLHILSKSGGFGAPDLFCRLSKELNQHG